MNAITACEEGGASQPPFHLKLFTAPTLLREENYMRRFLSIVLAVVMLLAVCSPVLTANAAGFKDVAASYWAYDQITALAAKKVIIGYADGTFKPEGLVTREEFAKMIVVAKGLALVKPSRPTFTDVAASRWSFGYVEAAAKAGYIKGYPGGTFKPASSITRQELAVLGVRVVGKESQALNLNKTLEQPMAMANDEQKVATWAYGAVTIAYSPEVQMMNYRKGRLIAPLVSATRAECANSIYMMVVPPKNTPVLTFAESQEPADLAGQEFANFAVSVDTADLIYDGLIGLDESPSVYYPRMAREVPSQANGLWKINDVNGKETMTVTYRLRKGLKWSDGQPFTSKDLEFAWEVRKNPDVPIVDNTMDLKIEKVETPDAYTVIYYFNVADLLGFTYGSTLYPEHLLRAKFEANPGELANDSYWDNPVGTGPYKLTKWVKGERLEFGINTNWFYGEPVSKTVIQYAIPNTNTIMANLLAKKVDIAVNTGSTAQQANMIRDKMKGSVNVIFVPSTYREHICLNTEDPILSDVRVRRALAYATDRDEISKVVYQGTYTPSYDWFDNLSVWDPSLVTMYPYSVSKANALLDEAGWILGADGYRYKDGKKLEIQITISPEKPARASTVEVLIKQWKQVGVSITTKSISWSVAMTETVPMGDFQATVYAWGGGSPFDLTAASDQIWTTEMIPTAENDYNTSNNARWSNADFDKAITAANNSANMATVIPNLKAAMKIWTDQEPSIFLLNWVDHTYVGANVKSYKPYPFKTWTDDFPFTYKQ
jgi:peptide/nickel transport system substrate-binding protein